MSEGEDFLTKKRCAWEMLSKFQSPALEISEGLALGSLNLKMFHVILLLTGMLLAKGRAQPKSSHKFPTNEKFNHIFPKSSLIYPECEVFVPYMSHIFP